MTATRTAYRRLLYRDASSYSVGHKHWRLQAVGLYALDADRLIHAVLPLGRCRPLSYNPRPLSPAPAFAAPARQWIDT